MEYRLELLTTMNNKLSKLEFSSTPSSEFRWESPPSFDNNRLTVDLNVSGDNLTEINNNVELLQAIINRAQYEYSVNGSTSVELRFTILDANSLIDQIGHLEVIGGEITGHNIGDVWTLNKQKQIRLNLFTVGAFRRYASKIYNIPEDTSTSIVNDINSRVGYKWINNILVNSHFDAGFLTGEIFWRNDEDVDWTTYWNTYGTSQTLVEALESERAMVPPYCVQITASGLVGGQTRGFHQTVSGVDCTEALGAMWYTFDTGADGNLVLELEHSGTIVRTVIDVGDEVINSHPLSNGYKLSTVHYPTTISGAVDYRVYMSGVANGNIYIGGTLLTAQAEDTVNNSYFDMIHPQDYVISGLYNTSTEDYDYWIPYISSTYIKNRDDALAHTTTSEYNVLDRNEIVVWGMPGDVPADTAIAAYFNEDLSGTTDTEEIFMGKQVHRDFWDYRNVQFFRNDNGSGGTNWTDDLTTGLQTSDMHNQSYARLDADGSTDGLYTFTYTYLKNIPLNLFKNMTFRAIGRFSTSSVAGVNAIRLAYSTARGDGSGTPTAIIYNPPADLTNLVAGEETVGGTQVPSYWTLLDLGLIKFDAGNITEYQDSNGDYVGMTISAYIDVDADNGTRVYLDDVFILPAEEFFYSDRGHNNVNGDWNIIFSREKQYSRYDSGINIRRMSLVSQDYDGVPLSISPWLPNRISYLQQRYTFAGDTYVDYNDIAAKDTDKALYGGPSAADTVGQGASGDTVELGNVGGNHHWNAVKFYNTSGTVSSIRFRAGATTGAPVGTVTWEICADDAGGSEPGTVLNTGTMAWTASTDNTVSGLTAPALNSGSSYWLVARPTTPQALNVYWTWRRTLTGSGFDTNTNVYESTDSGATWTEKADTDYDFTITTVATTYKWAAPFDFANGASRISFSVYMDKEGSPTDNITVSIQTNNAGSPSGTAITNGTLTFPMSRFTASYAFIDFNFYDVDIDANTTYWLVLEGPATTNTSNYVRIGADASAPPGGDGAMSYYNGSWNDASANIIWLISSIRSMHELEDKIRIWLGYNPKSKFLLARKPDPNP